MGRVQAMLLECSAPHWIPICERLAEQGVDVAYWTAWKPAEDAIRRAFPSSIFHDTIDAKRALPPAEKIGAPGIFDRVCQVIWTEEAQTVFDMLNRFDTSRDMTNVERSTLFLQMLLYWRKTLSEIDPGIVIFPAPPHVVYDYIVLALCRKLGIATLMFEEATIVPPYRVEMPDFVEGDIALRNAVVSTTRISQKARDVVGRLRGSYAEAKPYREVEAQRRMAEARQAGKLGALRQLEGVFKVDKAHEGKNDQNPKIVNVSSLEKERGVSIRQSFEGRFANTRYMLQRYEERLHTERLANVYDSLCDAKHLPQAPFVYFPMAGQPERTSNPQAGIFTNQLVLANVLASSLPGGWTLLIKEHPNQFHPDFAVNMCRNEDFYIALSAYANVRLVPTSADPFELIDACELVATTGGTSALEGVARGKPALLFGDAWYRDCPGVYRVRGVEDLQAGFAQGFEVPEMALERFVQAVMDSCLTGMADYLPDGYQVDEADNISNISSSILRRLGQSQLAGGL